MLFYFSPLFIGESSLTQFGVARRRHSHSHFSPLFIGESSLTLPANTF